MWSTMSILNLFSTYAYTVLFILSSTFLLSYPSPCYSFIRSTFTFIRSFHLFTTPFINSCLPLTSFLYHISIFFNPSFISSYTWTTLSLTKWFHCSYHSNVQQYPTAIDELSGWECMGTLTHTHTLLTVKYTESVNAGWACPCVCRCIGGCVGAGMWGE